MTTTQPEKKTSPKALAAQRRWAEMTPEQRVAQQTMAANGRRAGALKRRIQEALPYLTDRQRADLAAVLVPKQRP